MFLNRDEVRRLDRRAIEEFGVPGVVLMENAGRGAAELLVSLGTRSRVVLCCGKGNNGGDGFVIARHLDIASVPVRVLLFCQPDQLTGDAAINYRIIARSGLPIRVSADAVAAGAIAQEWAGAEWVVDALFGTGLSGPVRPPFGDVIRAINDSGVPVFAVDIPSGLDCDSGRPLGATVRARHTATFVAQKVGFREAAAREWLGTVHVLDIGAPRVLVEEFLRPNRIGGAGSPTAPLSPS